MYPCALFYDTLLVLINDSDVHLSDVETLAPGSYVCDTIILAVLTILITDDVGMLSPNFFPLKKKYGDTTNQKYL